MTRTRQLGISALLVYTIAATALRALRPPNDFAEAFWLLDYRFGFVKRGLIGEIVTLATAYLAMPVTEQLISVLSFMAFSIYVMALVMLSIRIIRKSGWSSDAVLIALVFLSSPFVVMSAHLVGYHDNIVILLGIFSIVALLKGRPWLGAILQVIALFTNEISLLLVFPSFCLAWLLINRSRKKSGEALLPLSPVVLPVCASLVLVVSQEVFLTPDFAESFASRLSRFPFIQSGRDTLVPSWVSASFLDYLTTQSAEFIARISSITMYGLILPSALAILAFTFSAFRILGLSVESLVVLGVCLAPQLMHLMAWDTARIWTYTILCAFLALWVYSETSTRHRAARAAAPLSLGAIAANAVLLTPLMDRQTDHFSLGARLLLYAPVVIAGMALVLRGKVKSTAERSRLRGLSVPEQLPSMEPRKAASPSMQGTPREALEQMHGKGQAALVPPGQGRAG